MKKKHKIVFIVSSILIFVGILLPTNVIAKEEKPELKWEQFDMNDSYNYRGNEIICDAGDGYITINNSNEITKYNYDGEKEKIIIKEFNDSINSALVDGDYLLIYTEDSVLYKYSLNGELIFKKDFEDEYNYSGGVYTYSDGYFIDYDYYDRGKHYDIIVKLDKEGNVVNTYSFDAGDLYAYILNNDNQLVLSIQNFNGFEFVIMDLNFNILSTKKIDLRVVDIFELKDGYLGYFSDNNFSGLIKIDKEGNIIWQKTLDNIIEDASDRTFLSDVGEVSDGYVLVGEHNYLPVFIKIDLNGNLLYVDGYMNDKYSDFPVGKIITLDNDDYIINLTMKVNMYSSGFGSVILKYGYKDYKITTNIEGKGSVSVSSTGKEGETISYSATPDDGYELKSIKVVSASGKEIETTDDNTFILPNEDVTIEVEFVKVLTENPNTGNTILLMIGISLVIVLSTLITLYYRKRIH